MTLQELVLAGAMLGVLALIYFPVYREPPERVRRAVAVRELLGLLERQEQFFRQQRRYAADLSELGLTDPYAIDADGARVDLDAPSRTYLIRITPGAGRGFRAWAEPQLAQARSGLCGTLGLFSGGVRYSSGLIPPRGCW